MKQYRIGDYARYLGVTPDLLKHYEEMGILEPQRSESGYRYYPFHTTRLLMESIRLRNYGFTLREIQDVLQAHGVDNARMEELLAGNMQRLEQEIQLDEALLEDYRDFQAWKRPLEKRDWDWEIRWSVPMYFLPHTDRDDFLQDPRIYEILNPWMSFIPIVKSAMRVEADGRITWGLLARELDVRRLHLPLNEAVLCFPSQKIFCYKYRGRVLRMAQEAAGRSEQPPFQVLRSLGLENVGGYCRAYLMPADWQREPNYHYGYYAIPIRD